MKYIFTFILSIFLLNNINAQTGIGIITYNSSPEDFGAINVDSTESIDLVFLNTVAAPQTITFSGLSAPFSIASNTLSIPANDSATISISFNPTTVGNFSDQLDWSGSIFGSGSLNVQGEGVQVSISVSTDTLNLGNTSIGQNLTGNLTVSNNGTGTMVISNITSTNPYFSVSPSSANISQGGSSSFTVTYNSVLSGNIYSTISIYSNDPFNPIYDIVATAFSVSELSGSLSDTLYAINSPYTLTNDISVSSSDTLFVEPGVYINGQGLKFEVDGKVILNGTANDSISLFNFSQIDLNNFDSVQYLNINRDIQKIQYFNLNCQSISEVESNFSFNCSPSQNHQLYNINDNSFYIWAHNSYCYHPEMTSKWFVRDDLPYFVLNFNMKMSNVDFDYRINNGIWQDEEYWSTSSWHTNSFNDYSYDYSNLFSEGDSIQFRFRNHSSISRWMYLKEFKINWIDDSDIFTTLNYNDSADITISNSTLDLDHTYFNQSGQIIFRNNFSGASGNSPGSGWSYYEYDGSSHVGNSTSYPYNNQSGNNYFYMYNYGYEQTVTLNQINLQGNGEFTFSFNYRPQYSQSTSYTYYYFERSVNGGSWTTVSSSNYFNQQWRSFTNTFTYSDGDYVRYRIRLEGNNGNNMELFFDNFEYNLKNVANDVSFTLENSRIIFNVDFDELINFEVNSSEILNSDIDLSQVSNFGFTNSLLQNSQLDHSSDYTDSTFIDNSIFNNGRITVKSNYGNIKNSKFFNSSSNGLELERGTYYLENVSVHSNAQDGINDQSDELEIKYSRIFDNNNDGIESSKSTSKKLMVSNCAIYNNNSEGIYSSAQLQLNYSNVTDNGSYGLYNSGFSAISNSIFWGNEYNSSFRQINSNGSTSIAHSSVMGLNGYGLNGSQPTITNSIDGNPMYLDTLFHLNPLSPCVDAGDPNELDYYMPEGLGGPGADAGMYGGPNNWYWGGNLPADGSPSITSIDDSPQDQGGQVGVLFDASHWDNSNISNNITEYSFWRHYDINGLSIDSVNQGNWELMGTMPAQYFNAYAFTSQTLGDSNLISGMFNSCFLVVAHTSDSSIYWNSNVLCGYSVDNLAPSAPLASARVNQANTEVTVHWSPPTVSDYSYSNVISTSGFVSLGVIDTSVVDLSILPGGSYTYGVVHFDVNGNASDTAWVSISVDDNEDVIPLSAGWNLISTSKIPVNNNMLSIFANLQPGNLIYVTGFNQGSSLYNPNGLPFLNTLNQLDQGYGYWIKVANDDTLRINGTTIDDNFKINLDAGWNLSGYMNSVSQTPNQYFSDLISNNNLIYATAFNQGTQLFNPNGLPFLNTLTQMERPFGYWIKVNNAVGGNQYRLSNSSGVVTSPEFMFVNGRSNLDNYVGQHVLVLNSNGDEMAKLEIIEQGYLMTTSLYGDDVTTDYIEGFAENEEIIFSFGGQEIKSDFNFISNMELQQVELEFVNLNEFSIYPNPAKARTNISFEVNDDCKVEVKVFDLTGKLLDVPFSSDLYTGYHNFDWNTSTVEKGIYIIKFFVNEKFLSSQRLVLQ